MEEPIIPERRFSAHAAQTQSPKRTVPFILLALVALVGGWHYLCRFELENALTELVNEFLHEHVEDGTALVEIGPLNNVIDIRIDLGTKVTSGLEKLIEDAVTEAFREQLEPEIERALQTRTRRSMDVYAMLLPYEVSITLGELDSTRPVTEPSPATNERAASAPPAHIDRLISQWADLNDRCRGGSGDDQQTWVACEQREELDRKLDAQGWCYGHEPEGMAEREWEPCRRR